VVVAGKKKGKGVPQVAHGRWTKGLSPRQGDGFRIRAGECNREKKEKRPIGLNRKIRTTK